MQHTEKRNFNIIETSDAFSPEALNENTRKFEAALDAAQADTQAVRSEAAAALSAEAAARSAADAALSQRVTVLEGFKFAQGTVTLDENGTTVQLGFTPVAVFIRTEDVARFFSAMTVAGAPTEALWIVENGFAAKSLYYTNGSIAFFPGPYYYIAFGTP